MWFIPRQLALIALLPLLVSCQTPVPGPTASPVAKPKTPSALGVPAPVTAARYRIRSDLSDVRFLVYRAGPLAQLGHNHVIQAGSIRGEVQLTPEFKASTLHLTLPVADFQVDNSRARREEGTDFAAEPNEEAIAGTRRNMLGDKVLDAARYAEVAIESTMITGPAWEPDITLRIQLHGVEKEVTVPVALSTAPDQLIATASFSIRQSDFDIKPLSVLGGGLQVADAVRIRLRLVATSE
jgi:polyisoprenoid-binding protein YceI